MGLILTNLGGKVPNSKKYIFFKSGSTICEGENFTFKRKQDIIDAAFVFAEVNNMRYNNS